ncbi:hypothetical protein J2Z66_002112 [Paenibacillus eucommiae]|uniref:Uncharacterized protein n=1 Tax=Paenibacillus eucommiae TaxID=1355755 RepID=A0ABS4IUG3_9BACL|nr:hypothetical protein [Paenibacillus eucommiae]
MTLVSPAGIILLVVVFFTASVYYPVNLEAI